MIRPPQTEVRIILWRGAEIMTWPVEPKEKGKLKVSPGDLILILVINNINLVFIQKLSECW